MVQCSRVWPGGLITFKDSKADLRFEVGKCAFQKRSLAGTGRTDEVQNQQPVGAEELPVSGRQTVVFGQKIFLDPERARLVLMFM